MATTYEQESEEDGDPWKDSSPSSSIRISSDLIEKSKPALLANKISTIS